MKGEGDICLRPNINCLVVPLKNAEESLFERPISSIIIQYILIVLHVIRQLVKSHEFVRFRITVVSALNLLLDLAIAAICVCSNQVHSLIIHLIMSRRSCFSMPRNRVTRTHSQKQCINLSIKLMKA